MSEEQEEAKGFYLRLGPSLPSSLLHAQNCSVMGSGSEDSVWRGCVSADSTPFSVIPALGLVLELLYVHQRSF